MVVAGKGPTDNVAVVEPGHRDVDLQHDWFSSSLDYGDHQHLLTFLSSHKDQSPIADLQNSDHFVNLTNSQQKVMDILEDQIVAEINFSQDVPSTQLTIVQGKAGCGKSTLIQTMTAKLTETLTSESFLLLAPTGSAALNINGTTIHSALSIPIRPSHFKPLEGESRHNFINMMSPIRFIIIDEYSMIGLSLLGMVEQRCREANPHNSKKVTTI
ncbi:uncharacterized protein LOC128987987 [Macrosteles quadrilineatus]|uniref:uncharacterized protein LOC128987987 n=1 Tax=Macrosteles quadrilineatus TaxID=74068 RepID=UPI0023E1F8E7|nr:uncharacterized protein LOC128987987 [Macrosteles quadrilineatus]